MRHLAPSSQSIPAPAIMDPCQDKEGIPNLWCEWWAYKGGVVY